MDSLPNVYTRRRKGSKGKLKAKNMLSARLYMPELPGIGLRYLGIVCPYRAEREWLGWHSQVGEGEEGGP